MTAHAFPNQHTSLFLQAVYLGLTLCLSCTTSRQLTAARPVQLTLHWFCCRRERSHFGLWCMMVRRARAHERAPRMSEGGGEIRREIATNNVEEADIATATAAAAAWCCDSVESLNPGVQHEQPRSNGQSLAYTYQQRSNCNRSCLGRLPWHAVQNLAEPIN